MADAQREEEGADLCNELCNFPAPPSPATSTGVKFRPGRRAECALTTAHPAQTPNPANAWNVNFNNGNTNANNQSNNNHVRLVRSGA